MAMWFDAELCGPPQRAMGALYAQTPEGVWAVWQMEPVHSDLVEESALLMAHYGAAIGGLGAQLMSAGVPVSPELEQWSDARDVPADQVPGALPPVLLCVDGDWRLALSWSFGSCRLYALTHARTHVVVLAPPSAQRIALVGMRIDPDSGRLDRV